MDSFGTTDVRISPLCQVREEEAISREGPISQKRRRRGTFNAQVYYTKKVKEAQVKTVYVRIKEPTTYNIEEFIFFRFSRSSPHPPFKWLHQKGCANRKSGSLHRPTAREKDASHMCAQEGPRRGIQMLMSLGLICVKDCLISLNKSVRPLTR